MLSAQTNYNKECKEKTRWGSIRITFRKSIKLKKLSNIYRRRLLYETIDAPHDIFRREIHRVMEGRR